MTSSKKQEVNTLIEHFLTATIAQQIKHQQLGQAVKLLLEMLTEVESGAKLYHVVETQDGVQLLDGNDDVCIDIDSDGVKVNGDLIVTDNGSTNSFGSIAAAVKRTSYASELFSYKNKLFLRTPKGAFYLPSVTGANTTHSAKLSRYGKVKHKGAEKSHGWIKYYGDCNHTKAISISFIKVTSANASQYMPGYSDSLSDLSRYDIYKVSFSSGELTSFFKKTESASKGSTIKRLDSREYVHSPEEGKYLCLFASVNSVVSVKTGSSSAISVTINAGETKVIGADTQTLTLSCTRGSAELCYYDMGGKVLRVKRTFAIAIFNGYKMVTDWLKFRLETNGEDLFYSTK